MIINGGSRSNGGFFSRHLLRADHNERIDLVEIRGLSAHSIPDAFREMKAVASGTRCTNYFYHANLNTREDERLTPEQWAEAIDALERGLGFIDQPRFIVEHDKEGRTHRHVVWSRIDADTMTALPDSHNYRTHELVAAELEEAFGHEATVRALTRDKDATLRPEPNVKDWESFRAQESKIDPKAMRAELTQLWNQADSGQAFAAALAERGYILTRGDRRDFCIVDPAGDEHALARRLTGVKAAAIRARMSDVDAGALPSVAEGRELARQRREEPIGGNATAEPLNAFDAIMTQTLREADTGHALPELSQGQSVAAEGAEAAFQQVMAETAQEAAESYADAAEAERREPGKAFAQIRAWWSGMRDYVAGWSQQAQDYYQSYFGREGPEQRPAQRHGQDDIGMEPPR